MGEERDVLDELGTAACPLCGELMVIEGDAREVDDGEGQLVAEGSVWWRCPRDGFVRLA